jgi:altronate hydrolase
MGAEAITITDKDNVAVVLRDIKAGTTINLADGRKLLALNDIPYSHKVALLELRAGEPIIKYGEIIGVASQDIAKGEWVHTHNLRSA